MKGILFFLAKLQLPEVLQENGVLFGIIALAVVLLIFMLKGGSKLEDENPKPPDVENPKPPDVENPKPPDGTSPSPEDIESLRTKILELYSLKAKILEHDGLKAKISELEKAIADSNSPNSFSGDDILFCPVSGNVMTKVKVEGETIDVSKAGCWFDGGELLSMLGRSDGILSKLLGRVSSVDTINQAVDREKEIESRKKLAAELCKQYMKTNDLVFKKKLDFHNAKIRTLNQPSGQFSGQFSGFQPGSHSTGVPSSIGVPSSNPSVFKPAQTPLAAGQIKCPATGQPMEKKTFEGIELDISPAGIWFDGGELLSILKEKPGFLGTLFHKTNIIESVESSVGDTAVAADKSRQVLETKRSIRTLAVQLGQLNPEDAQFSSLLQKLTAELDSLKKLSI